MRHPDKVERWLDRIPDVRHSGGMSENFRPGGMSDAMCCKGLSACPKGEGATQQFLGRIPHTHGY